jgi:hypothetical protein
MQGVMSQKFEADKLLQHSMYEYEPAFQIGFFPFGKSQKQIWKKPTKLISLLLEIFAFIYNRANNANAKKFKLAKKFCRFAKLIKK